MERKDIVSNDHSTNPTKPNKTAKAMPTAKCIPPSIDLIPPDEFPFDPPDEEEPVDVDVAPVAVPVAEVDVLEVEKVATGSAEMVVHVPPIKKKRELIFKKTIWF